MGISGENPHQRESRLRMSHSHSTALGLGFTFARTGTVRIALWSNSSSLGAFLEEKTPRQQPHLAENISLAEPSCGLLLLARPEEGAMQSIISAGTQCCTKATGLGSRRAFWQTNVVAPQGSRLPNPPSSGFSLLPAQSISQSTPHHDTGAPCACRALLFRPQGWCQFLGRSPTINTPAPKPTSAKVEQSLSKSPAKSAQTQQSISEQKGRKRQQWARWGKDQDGQQ